MVHTNFIFKKLREKCVNMDPRGLWWEMPPGGTFENGTQIILLKINGFLKGWILNITPLKVQLSVYNSGSLAW